MSEHKILVTGTVGVRKTTAIGLVSEVAPVVTDVRNSDASIDKARTTAGLDYGAAMCAAGVDAGSGMIHGSLGSAVDMEIAATGHMELVRAKLKTVRALGLSDVIEDMLTTLGSQYHVLRPSSVKEGLFLYVVLDKQRANLALARRKTQEVDKLMDF